MQISYCLAVFSFASTSCLAFLSLSVISVINPSKKFGPFVATNCYFAEKGGCVLDDASEMNPHSIRETLLGAH